MSLQPAIPWRGALPQSPLRFTGRDQNELKWSCRSIDIQQTANSVLTVCVSQGDNPSVQLAASYVLSFADQPSVLTGDFRPMRSLTFAPRLHKQDEYP